MAIFGFIGVGNMGGAMAKAAAKTVPAGDILVSSGQLHHAEALAEQLGAKAATNEQIAAQADYVILGIKPQKMAEVLGQLQGTLQKRSNMTLVSMAAGLSMEDICRMAGGAYPVIRMMPNLPVAVGCGIVLYDVNSLVNEDALQQFLQAMRGAGQLDRLPEKLMNAGSAVAGCGPAFVCQFLEALADGGVACGLPRVKAQEYAAGMLLGTAQLLLAQGRHPAELKDAVCSPGGTTIQGVRKLEQHGLRGAVIDAVVAAYEKNFSL